MQTRFGSVDQLHPRRLCVRCHALRLSVAMSACPATGCLLCFTPSPARSRRRAPRHGRRSRTPEDSTRPVLCSRKLASTFLAVRWSNSGVPAQCIWALLLLATCAARINYTQSLRKDDPLNGGHSFTGTLHPVRRGPRAHIYTLRSQRRRAALYRHSQPVAGPLPVSRHARRQRTAPR